ncbi:MAG: hypothetical protein K2W82_07710 [Candidatus Obscuribacterales bacterium]|nr:hypothetical protein [Candidatus Obscuribacterales bacterium]
MRTRTSLFLTFALCLIGPANAATNLDPPTVKELAGLELKFFDDNFNNDSDEARVGRIEKLVYGEVGTGSPKERIDKLVSMIGPVSTTVAAKTEAVPPVLAETNSTINDYPHVTELEKAILGQSYASDPLAQRFSRMEIKAFGSAANNPDFSQRTDALEGYAEKKLHKKPFVPERKDNPGQNSAPSRVPQILSMVGNSLLGMSGTSFSGVRVRQRQDVVSPQSSDSQETIRDEDPEVFEDAPPPAEAKLLTKVGWCEQHLFGHTFPDLHLLGRLGQLNQELKVKPGASNAALMDDIEPMIKAVLVRKGSKS